MRAKCLPFVFLVLAFRCDGHLVDVLAKTHDRFHTAVQDVTGTILGGFGIHHKPPPKKETVVVIYEDNSRPPPPGPPFRPPTNGPRPPPPPPPPHHHRPGPPAPPGPPHGYHNNYNSNQYDRPNQDYNTNSNYQNNDHYDRPNQGNRPNYNTNYNGNGRPDQVNNYGNNDYGRPNQGNNYNNQYNGRPNQNNRPSYGGQNQENGHWNQNNNNDYNNQNNNARPNQNQENGQWESNGNNQGNNNYNRPEGNQNNQNQPNNPSINYNQNTQKPVEPQTTAAPIFTTKEPKPTEVSGTNPTKKPDSGDDFPWFVPLNPNDIDVDKTANDSPKRETDSASVKPSDGEEEAFEIDIRVKD